MFGLAQGLDTAAPTMTIDGCKHTGVFERVLGTHLVFEEGTSHAHGESDPPVSQEHTVGGKRSREKSENVHLKWVVNKALRFAANPASGVRFAANPASGVSGGAIGAKVSRKGNS